MSDTPTDDEREALLMEARRAQRAVFLATDADVAEDLSRIIRGLADALEACSRRPEVPEPSAEGPHSRACGIKRHEHGRECNDNCPTCHGKTPQGEPSDAQVHAALSVYLDTDRAWADWETWQIESMRAALRAAGEAR